jgi:hypothetical protein
MKIKLLHFIIYVFVLFGSGFAQSVWEWRNPLPQGHHLKGVAYGNNQFIAVGEYSTILTSPEGVTWTERSSGKTGGLQSVVYGNNQFIAVGRKGRILSSKADLKVPILSISDRKSTFPLRITPVLNRISIQMPNTKHIGKELWISLFNAAGRTVYTTKMKMTAGKFNFPIPGLSQGVYLTKIKSGKSFEYSGSVAITR